MVVEDKEEVVEGGFKEEEFREAGVTDPEAGEEASEGVNREVEAGTDLTATIVRAVS